MRGGAKPLRATDSGKALKFSQRRTYDTSNQTHPTSCRQSSSVARLALKRRGTSLSGQASERNVLPHSR